MTTGSTDFYIKRVISDTNYVTLYNYKTGEPVRVPESEVESKLKIIKEQIQVSGDKAIPSEKYKLYVRTKDECIDSVVSDVVSEVAPASNIKRNKRKRGRRGKRNH